ncbi:MAG: tRNA (adenosine(37)-N6)-dimethylallyltransferase MiaA [Gammaproteobacteria bacterium]|jgi:tRNA dimethylallyltransferase|nr:tRNA (adenosine(37)-N6)-dimethylallyltransferase MiaA [Gammaproteobacteria bacterium]
MGPTAAGKTAAAFALHERFPVELVSVDSAQVYRGLDIGSAKPDAATLARHPHALIDIREPEATYSAADFAADAGAEIRRIHEAGRWPVLVGGTMLYYRALLFGLDPLPPADPALRRIIAAEAEERGWRALHAELGRHDPAAAAAIRPADTQRIQRALEILRLTGRGPSAHHGHNRLPRLETLRLVLTPRDRHILHERIVRRFDAMLEQGFIEEVERLRARPGLTGAHASMKSVGYRQVWWSLDDGRDPAECRHRAVAATRQLAKRQLTALRGMTGTLWHDSLRERTIDLIFRQVGEFFARAQARQTSA